MQGRRSSSNPAVDRPIYPRPGETGVIDDFEGPDDFPDPEKLRGCEYWRCGELFEARTVNQIFCRKACRSRQRKWERAQMRRKAREVVRRDRSPD